jgi:hypothetical protein
MVNLILGILTHRRLERYRVFVPYPVYVCLVTFVLTLPFILIALVRAPHEWPFLVSTAVLAPLLLAAINGLLAGIGWLSGYRPFVMRWSIADPNSLRLLPQQLKDAARKIGVDIMWEDIGGSFVGVLGIEREGRALTHSAVDSPVRVSLLIKGAEATFKVAGRTVVLWDTGEKQRFASLGRTLLSDAGAETLSGVCDA